MSFILDALKKSENDRQGQAEAEFTTIPASPDSQPPPRWLWALGALLVINALVLLGFVLRPNAAPLPASLPMAATTAAAQDNAIISNADPTTRQSRGSDGASFASQVEEVRRQQPVSEEPVAAPDPAAAAQQRAAVAVTNLPVSRAAILPTLMELRTNGSLQLPDLHLDIHVYHELPANRFVFINMDKYQENARLDAGPTVREITSDGVILVYQGITFMLPRE